jgi:hypothetical protein
LGYGCLIVSIALQGASAYCYRVDSRLGLGLSPMVGEKGRERWNR